MTLGEVAALVGGELDGPAELELTGLCTPEAPEPDRLAVAFGADALARAVAAGAAAVIAPAGLTCTVPAVFVAEPRIALLTLLNAFAPPRPAPAGIHPTAVVDPSARLGAGVTVGPHAVIEAGVVTGERCDLGAGCFVGQGARLGDEVTLHPRVVLYREVILGNRVIIQAGTVIGGDGFGYRPVDGRHVRIPQIGTVVIGDDVEIGSNTTIDRSTVGATRIGRGTKIDNLVVIAHNCAIGEDCIIISQVGIAGSVKVGDRVMLGGQVGIADHHTIGDGAHLGAQSGVMNDVPPGERWFGSPAMPQTIFFRMIAGARRSREVFARLRALETRSKERDES